MSKATTLKAALAVWEAAHEGQKAAEAGKVHEILFTELEKLLRKCFLLKA